MAAKKTTPNAANSAAKKTTPNADVEAVETAPEVIDPVSDVEANVEATDTISADLDGLNTTVEKTTAFIGKTVSPHGPVGGKVRLVNIATRKIITGFIPMSIAKKQVRDNPNIEILNDDKI